PDGVRQELVRVLPLLPADRALLRSVLAATGLRANLEQASERARRITRRHRQRQSGAGERLENHDRMPTLCLGSRRLRNLEHLAGLDLVRIAQLIAVEVEDLGVRAWIAELLFGDLAQRISRSHRIGALSADNGGAGACRLDVRDDVLPPIRNRLDRIPNLVRFLLRRHRAVEVELAVVLVRRALHPHTLRGLDGVRVLVSKSHCTPPLVRAHVRESTAKSCEECKGAAAEGSRFSGYAGTDCGATCFDETSP